MARKPGEIVKRQAGSGFIFGDVPYFIRVPYEPTYTEEQECCMTCRGDSKEWNGCREWANLTVVGGPHNGKEIYHISECQMADVDPEELEKQINEIQIKVFDYYPDFDAFLCTSQYRKIAQMLGVTEWTPVVWLCRLLARDQDFGEHIFDNWDERGDIRKKFGRERNFEAIASSEESLKEAAKKEVEGFPFPEGEDWDNLLIVVPDAFTERNTNCWNCKKDFRKIPCPECGKDIYTGADGPCHSDKVKKKFWTDLFKSLEISFDTIITVAREKSEFLPEMSIEGEKTPDLEEQIKIARNLLIGEK